MITLKSRKFFIRGALGLLVLVVLVVGFVGYLHTPSGRQLPIARKLLAALGYSCPADAVSAEDVTALRKFAASQSKDLLPTDIKYAPEFTIGKSTEREVQKWLSKQKVKCVSGTRGYSFIKCEDRESFPKSWKEKGPLAEFDFIFSQDNILVAVDILRNKLTPTQAYTAAEKVLADLRNSLGDPSVRVGRLNAKSFQENFDIFLVEYNFRNYTARVSVSKLPESGVIIYEQYLSLD